MSVIHFNPLPAERVIEAISSGRVSHSSTSLFPLDPSGDMTADFQGIYEAATKRGLSCQLGWDNDVAFNPPPSTLREKIGLLFFCALGQLCEDRIPVIKIEAARS